MFNFTRWGSIPDEIMAQLKAMNPKADILKAMRTIAMKNPAGKGFWVPADAMMELLDTFIGATVIISEISNLVIRRDPESGLLTFEDYGVMSRKVITTAGVNYIAAQWVAANDTNTIRNFKFVGIGTGTGAEATSDTALGTELTTEYNPDSTRATGTGTNPSANIVQEVATNTLDSGTPAITEAGLLSQAATGGGTLWDRFKFSAINLTGANGDGIQSTIKATFVAGG